ncbi:cytochrome c oxidase assembly protein [Sphingomonas adhaesiva]|uniref:cytochrome c oxidase assembly protein n=1 Tax=Sphingomonas adhaesiva TaxID=28212 RepID=UPI002FF5BA51
MAARATGWIIALAATLLAFAGLGMTGHMAAHMVAVAVAAPVIAAALRCPRAVHAGAPLAWAMAEFVVVWGWHAPALRDVADMYVAAALLEQAMFLVLGIALWRAALAQPAAGAAALLLTSMHMTLLGALIGLADRPLYAMMAMHPAPGLDALADQQLGGVVMLLVGGASYCLGGLWMLGTILREARPA